MFKLQMLSLNTFELKKIKKKTNNKNAKLWTFQVLVILVVDEFEGHDNHITYGLSWPSILDVFLSGQEYIYLFPYIVLDISMKMCSYSSDKKKCFIDF